VHTWVMFDMFIEIDTAYGKQFYIIPIYEANMAELVQLNLNP